jgi:uncharacterized protein
MLARTDPEVSMLLLRLLALSLLFAVAAPVLAEAQSVDLRRKITVTGQSSTLVANDAARLTLGVQATRPSAKTALDAASRQMQRVIGAVKASGVAPPDIRTQNIAVSRIVIRLKGGRTRSRGYRASQSIRVVVRDIERTGIIVQRAVGAGATRVSGPEFFVFDASRSYREALALAFEDARAEAQALAERAGGRLGAVLSIEEQSGTEPLPQASAPNAPAADAPSAPPPVQAGESRLEASVVVVFELVG